MALFSVLFDIAAKTASFEASMTRVERRLDSVARVAKNAFEFVAVAEGFEHVREQIDKSIEHGNQLEKLAAQFNVTVESVSQLEYAAYKSDTELQELVSSFNTLSKGGGMAAEGLGRTRRAFQDLSIDAKKFADLSINEQINVLADAIATVPNPTQQTRLAIQLFGEQAGPKLLLLLRQGSKGIDELRQKSDELGHTMATSTAQGLSAAEDSIKDLNSAMQGLRDKLAGDVTPAISKMVGWMGTFLEKTAAGVKATAELFAKLKYGSDDPKERYQEEQNKLLVERRNLLQSIGIAEADNAKQSTHAYDTIIAQANARLAPIEARLNVINKELLDYDKMDLLPKAAEPKKSGIDTAIDSTSEIEEVHIASRKRELSAMEQYYQELDDLTKTSMQKELESWYEKELAVDDLRKQGLITAEDAASRLAEIEDSYLQEFEVRAKKIPTAIETAHAEASEFAKQAARNMQNYFEEFFFDPFKNGLNGMLSDFIDVIRRMVANAAAAKLGEALFGKTNSDGTSTSGLLSSVVGAIFGGFKADGGPLQQNKWYIAGEHGAEPVWGGGAGAFATGYGNSGSTTIAPTYNINITGEGVTRAQVATALKQTHDATVATMQDMKRRGKF